MTIQWVHRTLTVLVTIGLLSLTAAGASAPSMGPLLMARVDIAPTVVVIPEATPETNSGEPSDEEDSGGWLDGAVDRVGDVAGDIKDTTADVAETSWDVVKEAPGAAWEVIEDVPSSVVEFVKQIPGTVARLWEPVWDVLTLRFEIPGLPEFLANHPLIRTLMLPLLFLFGIAYDGTMSILDAGLISLIIIVPFVKGVPIVVNGIQKVLPWSAKTKPIVSTIGRNPNGIISGATNAFRLSRARSIAPTSSSIQALPHTQGVYVALDASGKPLYVGMTNSFNRRLGQHFSNSPSSFASQTSSIKILNTNSIPAARALECSLIQQLDPSHNKQLKGRGICPIYTVPSPSIYVTP